MTREEVINLLEDKVRDYVTEYPYEPNCDGDVSVNLSKEFGLVNGLTAEVYAHVNGRFWHNRGDYFTPPESGGSISWAVRSIEIFDEDGGLIVNDTDITEMNGEHKF